MKISLIIIHLKMILSNIRYYDYSNISLSIYLSFSKLVENTGNECTYHLRIPKFSTSQVIKVFFMKMETKYVNFENFISAGAN